MVLVLTLVAVIMGGILAFVNHLTEGPINEQKAKALADGIKTVMVSDNITVADPVEVKQDIDGKEAIFTIYQVKDAQGQDLGAAVESTTGGFGGDLKVLVGFNPEGKLRPQVWVRRPTSGSRRARRVTSLARTPRSPWWFPRTVARWMPSPLLPSPAVPS